MGVVMAVMDLNIDLDGELLQKNAVSRESIFKVKVCFMLEFAIVIGVSFALKAYRSSLDLSNFAYLDTLESFDLFNFLFTLVFTPSSTIFSHTPLDHL